MAGRIKQSIEELPLAERQEGRPPARNNFVAEALAEAWYEQYLAEGNDVLEHSIPEAGPYRASMAGSRCDRALYYRLNKTEPSNPPSIADAWRMGLGSMIHASLQEILAGLFPDAVAEAVTDLRKIGIPGSGHADLAFTYKAKRTLVEVKTVGGFQFKLKATRFKGPPQGPRYGDVLQAALQAEAHDCEQIVIVYLAMENVSADMADYSDSEAGRFAAEWHYTLEQLQPMVLAEKERIARLIENLESETLPPRELHDPTEYPEGAVVVDPYGQATRGTYHVKDGEQLSDTGTTWMCGYCWHRDLCTKDGE